MLTFSDDVIRCESFSSSPVATVRLSFCCFGRLVLNQYMDIMDVQRSTGYTLVGTTLSDSQR